MAREIIITVISADNFVEVFDGEISPAVLNQSKMTGLGAWSGEWQGQYQQRLVLVTDDWKTGSFAFSDISAATVDGTDVLALSSDLQELLTYLAPTMFTGGDAANPLPAGAATSANQDTGNASLSSIDTKLSSQSTAANQTTLLSRLGEVQASPTANTLLDRLKTLATLLGPGDGSVAASTNGLLLAVVTSVLEQEIFLPKSSAAPQLTTQGATTGYIDVEGSKSGSFNWMFTKGAGTDGTGILYGNNDGINAAFDVEIQSTGSQTADAAGVISWTLPWKYIKFVFTTQTGAGSTFDGSIYAL